MVTRTIIPRQPDENKEKGRPEGNVELHHEYQEWLGRRMEGTLSYPDGPTGKIFFNILATFAEFEADLIRMRTREGMATPFDNGKLRGKQPKLSDRQQREPCRMHATGDCSISDLAELFSVPRPKEPRRPRLMPRLALCFPLPNTLSKWLAHGRADIRAEKRQTAYARFAQKYDQIQREHCTDDANRNREFDLALQILERSCECVNKKMTMPDGTLGDAGRQRQNIEDHGRHRRPHTRHIRPASAPSPPRRN